MTHMQSKLDEMIALMNQHEIPEPNKSCKNCAYSEQYAKAIYQLGVSKIERQGSLF